MHNVRATKASEILATSASELNTRSSQFSIHNSRKKKNYNNTAQLHCNGYKTVTVENTKD